MSDRTRVRNDAIRCIVAIGVVLSPFAAIAILGLVLAVVRTTQPSPCTIAPEVPLTSPDATYVSQLVRTHCIIGFGGDLLTWTVTVASRADPRDRSDVFGTDDYGDSSRPLVQWTANDHLRITAESSLNNGLTKTITGDGRVSVSYAYRISPTPETVAKFHAFCASGDRDRLELTTWRGQRPGWFLFYRGECGRW